MLIRERIELHFFVQDWRYEACRVPWDASTRHVHTYNGLLLGDREALLDLGDAYSEVRDTTPDSMHPPDAFQTYAYAGLQAGIPQRGSSLD